MDGGKFEEEFKSVKEKILEGVNPENKYDFIQHFSRLNERKGYKNIIGISLFAKQL